MNHGVSDDRVIMRAVFHQSQSVSREELQRLSAKNNGAALLRVGVQAGLIGASVVAVLSASGWWLLGAGTLACGLLITTCFAPLHECSHLTAFASRGMNAVVAWLAGLPLMFPPTLYREFHFEHHRHTHDPKRDPEIAAGGERFAMWPVYAHEYFAVATGMLLLLLRLLTLLALAIGPNEYVWGKLMPFVRRHARRQAVVEARGYVLIYSAVGAAAITWAPQAIWLLASLVIGHSALALYLLSEHTGLPTDGSIFDRTRTTFTNRVVRYLMWNMPYHAEHHAFPSVPFHALPRLHELAKSDLLHTAPGYLRLHGGVVRGLRYTGRPRRAPSETQT